MSDKLDATISISADTSGVEAGIDKTKKSLKTLGTAAQQTADQMGKSGKGAGAGFEAIGTGVAKSAKDVERATRSMQQQLQRQVAELNAGGKATREYTEALARMRGVDVNALRPLLDQLDSARKKTDDASKSTEGLVGRLGGLKSIASGVLAGVSVGTLVADISNVTREVVKAAAEFENLAALSNTSTKDFQRLAAGANTVGISAEKMADIFKDVQDKVGDFVQTGGGGMADFFERVAPKVGVTADQFRKLSGKDALQLYVSSLEKANLAQSDMVFFMEAIASDSTMLLPLLANQGHAWQELGDKAEAYGAVMDGRLLEAAKAFKAETDSLALANQGLRNELVAGLLPALSDLTGSLSDQGVQGGLRETIALLGDMATSVIDLGSEFMLGMKYADGFWDAVFKYGLSNPFKAPQEQLESLGQELEKERGRAEKFSLFWTEAQRAASAERQKDLQQQVGYYQALQKLSNDRATRELDRLGREGLPTYESFNAPTKRLSAGFSKPAAKSSALKAEENAYQSLSKSIAELLEQQNLEIATGEKVSNAQKLRMKVEQEVAKSKRAGLLADLDQAEANENWLKNTQDVTKAQSEMQRAREQALKTSRDAVQGMRDEEDAYAYAEAQSISLAQAKAELAVQQANLNYQQAIERQEASSTLAYYEEQLRLAKEIAAATGRKDVREANKKAAEDAAKEWEKVSQTIGDTLADYIMGGGKDAATYLKRLFATLVLEPVVNYGVQSLLGAVGMGGGSAGGQQGLGGIFSLLSNGSSAYGAMAGGGSTALNMGQMLSNIGLKNFGGGMAAASSSTAPFATGLKMMQAGNWSGGAGSMAGGAMSYAGYAAAIAYGMKLSGQAYEEGYRLSNKNWLGLHAATGGVAPVSLSLDTKILEGIGFSGKTANMITGASLWAKGAAMLGLGPNPKQHSGGVYSDAAENRADVLDELGLTKHARGDFTSRQNTSIDSALADTVGGLLDAYDVIAKRAEGTVKQLDVFAAFATNPINPKEDAYGYLKIQDALTGATLHSSSKRDGDGLGNDPTQAFSLFTGEIAGVLVQQLKSADLPDWMESVFDSLGDTVTLEGFQSALIQIAAIDAQFDELGKRMSGFAGITDDVKSALMGSLGGIEGVTQAVGGFYQSFYSEAERMESLSVQVQSALAGLDISIDPRMGETAKEQFKAAVEGALQGGQGELAAQLLGLNQAFATAADYAVKSTAALDEFANAAMQAQLDAMDAASELASNLRASLIGLEARYANGGFSRLYQAQDAARDLQPLVDQVGWETTFDEIVQGMLSHGSAEVERISREMWEGLDSDEARMELVRLTGVMLDLAAATDEMSAKAAQAAAQAMSGSWSNFGTMAGLAAQHLGNSSGLAAQLGVVQQSYAGATDTSGRVAALQQIISLEQGIWNAQQESRQAEATAAQGRATAARSQLQSVNQLISAAKSLGDYASKLGYSEASGLTDSERFDALQSQYLQLLGKAKAGDVDAMGELQGVSSSYLSLAEQMAVSQSDYSVFSGRIAAELSATSAIQSAAASSQASQLERQIAAAESAAASTSAQFAVSTATQKLIDELLLESAFAFKQEASATQLMIDNGTMTVDALTSLPKELAGAIGSSLIPAINGIASAILGVTALDGSHAGGLSYVPFDGYRAELHKGERVLTAAENRAFQMPMPVAPVQQANKDLELKVERLEAQMGRMADATEKLLDITDRVSADGNANATEIMNVKELAKAIAEAMA